MKIKLMMFVWVMLLSYVVIPKVLSQDTTGFSGTPTIGLEPLTVNFIDYNVGSYSWNFGDPDSGANNTSTIYDPNHTYDNTGAYTVQVTDGTGTLFGNITVYNSTDTQPISSTSPVIFYTGTSGSGYLPVAIQLNSGAPNTINVTVNDGNPSPLPPQICSTNCIPRYWVFAGSPTFTATITFSYSASDLSGVTEGALYPEYYNGSSWVQITSGVTRNLVNHTLTVSGITPTQLFSTCWTLEESDQTVTASFIATNPIDTATYFYSFQDTSSGGPTSWSWTFGDGGTSNVQNPYYSYANSGSYTVTLTASNCGGSSSPVTQTVAVYVPTPVTQPVTSGTINYNVGDTTGAFFVQVSNYSPVPGGQTITVSAVNAPPGGAVAPNFTFINSYWSITQTSGAAFTAEITFSYTMAALSGTGIIWGSTGGGATDEDSLLPMYWTGSAWSSVAATGSGLPPPAYVVSRNISDTDPTAIHTITIYTDHFSAWTLGAQLTLVDKWFMLY